MKIRFTVSMSGPELSVAPGDEIEIAEEEATRLVAAGFAEPMVKAADKGSNSAGTERATKRKVTETR